MTKNKSVISIVLPSYNGEKYLKEAIESIINQTIDNWELILVNDGSIDNTGKIMKHYAKSDNRISYINNDNNLNLANSLNIGFNKACGKYYSWISDDNLFKVNALEIMLNNLNLSDNIDIVFANYDLVSENGDLTESNINKNIDQKIYYKASISMCFLYNANCHKILKGYNTKYRCGEDYDFFLKAYYYGFKFKVIDDNIYKYRQHNNSMSSKYEEELTYNTEDITIKNMENNISKLSRNQKSKIYLRLFLRNKYKLNFNFLKKAFIINPIYILLRFIRVLRKIKSFYNKK